MIAYIAAEKKFICLFLLLIVAFFITRLVNLSILPIFTDEAIYIRWSQIGGNDAAWRFISLTDGKQPLYTWFAMIMLRLFSDPLIAGRMVSVIAGFASLLGIAFLSFELFRSKRITLLSSGLYIISPFALMYDRLALYDSLSTAFSIWSCYLAVRLMKHQRLDIALVLGMVLGLGMINKTSGFLSLYLLPFTFIFFDWKKENRRKRMLRWCYLAGVSAVISQIIYAVLRLSPFFHMIAQKDSVFVYSVTEFMYTWRFFIGNMRGLLDWFINYLTIPIVAAMIPAFFFWKKDRKVPLFITIWCLLPLLALGYFGKVLYPRYILFMVIPLLMLTAVTVDWLFTNFKHQLRLYVLLFVLIFFALRSSYYIIINPVRAPIPFSDRGQLLDDWPAGWGIKEVNNFLTNESTDKQIAVFTEGTFGLLPYAIELYHGTNKNMTIQGFWPITDNFREDIENSAKEKPTFVILNHSPFPPASWPMEEILRFEKGRNPYSTLRLYKVTLPTI